MTILQPRSAELSPECTARISCAMTTPAEHLALPDVEDIKEGTIVTRIAAHAADLTKEGVRERARAHDAKWRMARRDLDWNGQFKYAIDPDKAKAIHARSQECRYLQHVRGVMLDQDDARMLCGRNLLKK